MATEVERDEKKPREREKWMMFDIKYSKNMNDS
jgi:hypothetical protein